MSLRRLILVVILDGPCTLVVPGPDLVERCPKLPSFACGGHMMRRCGAGNENRQRRSGHQARAGESCARSGLLELYSATFDLHSNPKRIRGYPSLRHLGFYGFYPKVQAKLRIFMKSPLPCRVARGSQFARSAQGLNVLPPRRALS